MWLSRQVAQDWKLGLDISKLHQKIDTLANTLNTKRSIPNLNPSSWKLLVKVFLIVQSNKDVSERIVAQYQSGDEVLVLLSELEEHIKQLSISDTPSD